MVIMVNPQSRVVVTYKDLPSRGEVGVSQLKQIQENKGLSNTTA